MRITVFGMGYVGCVTAACLADGGNTVVGVDINPSKVEAIASGRSPIVEAEVPDIVAKMVGEGRLTATRDQYGPAAQADLFLICVGTPSDKNGNLDLRAVAHVSAEIGRILADRHDYSVVAVRSTVLPGTTLGTVLPILEAESSRRVGEDFGLVMYPEFLREGTAVSDFRDPPKTVIGEFDARSGEVVATLTAGFTAPEFRCPIPIAESVKYVDNAFHALKITFANEIGAVLKAEGVDSHEVMSIFKQDRKLNISDKYLTPGFAFGGSCLGKDLRAFTYRARHNDVEVPVLSSVLASNAVQIARILRVLEDYPEAIVGFFGLSFKRGTDDLRESPLVRIAEHLIGRGKQIVIYDEFVRTSTLTGANLDTMKKELPHLSKLMVDEPETITSQAQVVVVGHSDTSFRAAIEKADRQTLLAVIDLVRLYDDGREVAPASYHGVAW